MGLPAVKLSDVVKATIYGWDHTTRKVQRIKGLKITPQPTAAIFSFWTVQPTVPVIEIFRNLTGDPAVDMKPQNLVATAFDFLDAFLGNLFTQHKARVTGLSQGDRFHYRITAGDGAYPSAVVIGTFATCSRNLGVIVHDIMVFNDGDPGLKASGEFNFGFGFYYENTRIADRSYDANIESGEVRDFPLGKGATLNTGQVPDTFTIFVRGTEYDVGFFDTDFGTAYSPPEVRPEQTVAYESDDETVAEAMQTFDMPQAPGNYNQGYTLKSGPQGINYWVNGRIDIEVLPPSEPPHVPLDIRVDIGDATHAGFSLTRPGDRGGVGGSGGGGKMMHAFAMGPEETLYMKRPGAESWEKLDDGAPASARPCSCDFSAEIAQDSQDRIHVLTWRAGVLRHAAYAAKSRGTAPRFRVIGEGLQQGAGIVTAEDGTAFVLARNMDGALRVSALNGDRGTWTELGGRFAGPVAALAGKREIEIFGVTPEGEAQAGTWRIGSSRRPDWSPIGRGLGRAKLRHLDVMTVERNQAMLLALAEDRRLLTLARGRNGEAWTGAWKDQGSLDTVFFSKAAPQKPAAKKTARRKNGGTLRPLAHGRQNGEERPRAAE